MDISEQRLYQLIQNAIQFGETLYDIKVRIEEYKQSIIDQHFNQTLLDQDISLMRIQIQEQESRRNTYTNLLYECVQEMKEHKKYKSYLKSGVCFYCGLGYVILRNHYANPKSACSAKYR